MTFPPKRILVPVDFGEASAVAVAVASALARQYGADVEAMHVEVLDAPPYFTHEQVRALEAQRANAREAAERYLASFVHRHGAPGARVTIAEGAPAEVILAHAARADVVVMGTNDRSRAARWWLGSVAERVHRESAVPVLVVRASDSKDPREFAAQLRQEAAARAAQAEEKR